MQPVQQLVGGAGAVDPDQDLPAGPVPGPVAGSWRSAARMTVRWSAAVLEPAFPGRSSAASGSPGAGRAVVDERPQRVVPEPVLERRRRAFLLRVRGDQGGVHVDDQRSTRRRCRGRGRGHRPAPTPGPGPRRGRCRSRPARRSHEERDRRARDARPVDPLVDRAVRLFSFLGQAQQQRNPSVPDLEAYRRGDGAVHWLHELPDHPAVHTALRGGTRASTAQS